MNKTTITIYANKRNPSKRLEVHNDGYYHNSVKAYMYFNNGVINQLGDGNLHRWRKKFLNVLLEDYVEICKFT